MFCRKCGFTVSENDKFCPQCGAALTPQNENSDFDPQSKSQNFRNEYRYGNGYYENYNYSNQNFNGQQTGELSPKINNTFPIIMIIVNVVLFDLIGLILAILSLVNYNNYENALGYRDYMLAEQYKQKSMKFAKASLVFRIVMAVIEVVLVFVAMAVGLFAFTDSGVYFETFVNNDLFGNELMIGLLNLKNMFI